MAQAFSRYNSPDTRPLLFLGRQGFISSPRRAGRGRSRAVTRGRSHVWQNFHVKSELAVCLTSPVKPAGFYKRNVFLLELSPPLQHLHSAASPAALTRFLHKQRLKIWRASERTGNRNLQFASCPAQKGLRVLPVSHLLWAVASSQFPASQACPIPSGCRLSLSC